MGLQHVPEQLALEVRGGGALALAVLGPVLGPVLVEHRPGSVRPFPRPGVDEQQLLLDADLAHSHALILPASPHP